MSQILNVDECALTVNIRRVLCYLLQHRDPSMLEIGSGRLRFEHVITGETSKHLIVKHNSN